MRYTFQNIKLKIGLHSLGAVAICLILFLFSLYFTDISASKYAMGGVFTGVTLTTLFRRKRYLTCIQIANDKIVVHYLNQILLKRSVELDNTNLDLIDIKAKNWWFGELDSIILSNQKTSYKFVIVDNKLKQTLVKKLGYE